MITTCPKCGRPAQTEGGKVVAHRGLEGHRIDSPGTNGCSGTSGYPQGLRKPQGWLRGTEKDAA